MIANDSQQALAGLRRWQLERDDTSDPNGRIYKDSAGTTYHSVTRILSATSPPAQKKALENWLRRPSASAERDQAALRGTLSHAHAEYLLKTGAKLARNTANKRNAWRTGADGLERHPAAITAWALERTAQKAPRVSWSAAGYARGLRHWILGNVTAIHSIEFSVHHPAGFAGSCDALIDLSGTLTVADWKTSGASAHQKEETKQARLLNYRHQLGAYNVGLKHLTGIVVPQAAIVLARRTGPPEVTILNQYELEEAGDRFLQRCESYFASFAGS